MSKRIPRYRTGTRPQSRTGDATSFESAFWYLDSPASPAGPDMRFSWEALNGVPIQVAIINETGRVLTVNTQWEERFGRLDGCALEADYLWFLRNSSLGAANARRIISGFKDVFAGALPEFRFKFPIATNLGCDGWFAAVVTALSKQRFMVSCFELPNAPAGEQSLADNHALLMTLIEGACDGIFIRDLEGVCWMANSAFSRIIGKPVEEIIGRLVPEIFMADSARTILIQEHLALTQGSVRTYEVAIESTQGERNYRVSSGSYCDHSGEAIGIFSSLRDITERKEIAKEVIELGEREKQRIATDLHDEICQDLAATSLISRLLEKRLAGEGSVHAKVAGQIATMAKDLAITARNLVHNLAPAHLAGDGFVEVLQRMATSISMAFPVKCEIEGKWADRMTDDAVAIQLYRITHEAMYNSAKHSGGSRITVRLITNEKGFTVSVTDNGAGFKPGIRGNRGIGLSTMEYRAGLIGATIKIDSVAGRGTTVACNLLF